MTSAKTATETTAEAAAETTVETAAETATETTAEAAAKTTAEITKEEAAERIGPRVQMPSRRAVAGGVVNPGTIVETVDDLVKRGKMMPGGKNVPSSCSRRKRPRTEDTKRWRRR